MWKRWDYSFKNSRIVEQQIIDILFMKNIRLGNDVEIRNVTESTNNEAQKEKREFTYKISGYSIYLYHFLVCEKQNGTFQQKNKLPLKTIHTICIKKYKRSENFYKSLDFFEKIYYFIKSKAS